MAAGIQPTIAGINVELTDYAVELRDLCAKIAHLNAKVGQRGTAGLVALGASQGDAADIVAKAAVLNTVAAVYYGQVANGDPPTAYDFDDALTSLWGDR